MQTTAELVTNIGRLQSKIEEQPGHAGDASADAEEDRLGGRMSDLSAVMGATTTVRTMAGWV